MIIKAFGAIKSPKDVRDYRAVCAVNSSSFPTEFELEMPEVKNQGSVGSCVAHSLATVVEYFSRHQGDDDRAMSTGYIYGNRLNSMHSGVGMVVRDAIAETCVYGTVPNEMFPHNVEVPLAIQVFQNKAVELYPHSYPNRLTSYYRLYTDAEIKASLMQNGPVVFAMEWFSDIVVEDGIMKTKQVKSGAYHCMVIYGWNASGWKIQNSWGIEFGDNGRAILPYDIPHSETWGVVDTYSEAKRVLKIKELEHVNSELTIANDQLASEIKSLTTQLVEYKNANSSEWNELMNQLAEKTIELEQKQRELAQCQEEISVLKQEMLDIKKPYNSSWGKVIAKVLNFINNLLVKK